MLVVEQSHDLHLIEQEVVDQLVLPKEDQIPF